MQSTCDFTAGWFSGIAGLLIGHPLDTVKVRQQTFTEHRMFSIIKKTLQKEGIRGFYKGMGFPIVTAGAYNSLFFGAYATVLRYRHSGQEPDGNLRRFCCESGILPPLWHTNLIIAGGIGGATTVMLGAPVELIKTQLQVMTDSPAALKQLHKSGKKTNKVTGPVSCAKHVYELRGLRGFYIGGVSMLLRDIPSFSVYILSYEHIVCLLQGKMISGEHPRGIYQIIAGGFAGILSWMFLMPLDVIKSKIQADDLISPKYKGIIDCFIQSYKQEGTSIFFQGIIPCMVRAFPVNAAVFYVYQLIVDKCDEFYFSLK
ncbi:hypothetical protein O3M35_007724 [Rhynocoris fuscipes]|uniref:Uncharacterized protein n=1 Tax=Rhynocoris fuscipes TaxID=488301 RepID=A0AAW1DCZ3_9HEMI